MKTAFHKKKFLDCFVKLVFVIDGSDGSLQKDRNARCLPDCFSRRIKDCIYGVFENSELIIGGLKRSMKLDFGRAFKLNFSSEYLVHVEGNYKMVEEYSNGL